MTARLRGHTAIVTLDSAGSAGLARRLAREGARVVVVAPNGRRDGRSAAALEDGGAGPAAVFCLEGGAEDELGALVELVAELSHRTPAGGAGALERPDGAVGSGP